MRAVREALGALGLLFAFAYIALHWSALPAQVPLHFGFNGRPNNYGPKATLLLLPALMLLLYVGLTAIVRFPYLFNFPVQVTDQNRADLWRLGTDLVGWIKTILVWDFAWILVASVHAAQTHNAGLSLLGVALFPISLLAVIGIYLRRMLAVRGTS